MKYQVPEFLKNVNNPFEGEKVLRIARPSQIIIGVDEVGRGPLAGPVVACVTILKNAEMPETLKPLTDSKKLSQKMREAIYEDVKKNCLCYAIAYASVEEIDRLNILEADFLAMRRALTAIGVPGVQEAGSVYESFGKIDVCKKMSDVCIAVDGNLTIRGVPETMQLPVVKGDSRVASISAASVLAKVYRDRLMTTLSEKYPFYGFEKNAGYGTKKHLEAIKQFGFTPEHRRSFHPKSLLE